jgi:hypothetical protein
MRGSAGSVRDLRVRPENDDVVDEPRAFGARRHRDHHAARRAPDDPVRELLQRRCIAHLGVLELEERVRPQDFAQPVQHAAVCVSPSRTRVLAASRAARMRGAADRASASRYAFLELMARAVGLPHRGLHAHLGVQV